MATAQFDAMGVMPNMLKSDLDMDTFFDFNQGTPFNDGRASSSKAAGPSIQSPYDESEEKHMFSGPSHDYSQFKQQTGISMGGPSPQSYAGPSFGNDGYGMTNMGGSWSTGFDMDSDMDFSSNMPAMFYPSQQNSQDFIDPNSIDGNEELQSNVGRVWPGMHSQQAQEVARARAENQRMTQPQVPQQQSKGKQRASSQQSDPHTEESISRLLSSMRHGSHVPTIPEEDDGSVQDGFMPNASRMKKDEEDMDEDERLLASEEGKKLSSKERRQLRNKVSARAFRSRRKEYIGQLEGEVAMKVQEANDLKVRNQQLDEENGRYRHLIKFLLNHPSFGPVMEDLSKDPNFLRQAPQQSQQQQQKQRSVAPTPVPSQPQHSQPRNASQMSMPPKQESHQVNMTMIPETPVDLSMLDINRNGNFAMQQGMNFNNFHNQQMYPGQHMQQAPSKLDIAFDMVKQSRHEDDFFPSFNGMH